MAYPYSTAYQPMYQPIYPSPMGYGASIQPPAQMPPYQQPQNVQSAQYPQQGQQSPAQGQNSAALVGRIVTSKEEALAVPFTSTWEPMYFPDWGHGVIYCKRLNSNTGAADLLEFRVYPSDNSGQTPQYTPIDVSQALAQRIQALEDEIAQLKTSSPKRKGGNDG